MKKVVLVDGNNLLFRSYYATAYTGNIMKNRDGFPTNGLYGFVNMMNKIIHEEKPEYIVVAFDVGKTFRHEDYVDYKGGRNATPDDLKMQFPVAKEILTAMGIKYLECPGYEADDIIGTFAKMVDDNDDFIATIVSSDKDLLQLISDDVTVKLLKTKDYIWMDHAKFVEIYGIEPIRMIDLKGLMGDSSDNIPGVKGVGEKTALKLLQEYGTIENLYNHIDEVKGAVANKLRDGQDSAFMSKKIATIYCDAPLDVSFADVKYGESSYDKLVSLYTNLEFHSFLKSMERKSLDNDVEVQIISDNSSLMIDKPFGFFLEMSEENYHRASIIGVGIYNDDIQCFIPFNYLSSHVGLFGLYGKYTYDLKKVYVSFQKLGISLDDVSLDLMVAGSLLNYSMKDDIAYFANDMGYSLEFYNKKEELSELEIAKRAVKKAKFIYEQRDSIFDKLKDNGVLELYEEIELPLTMVLGRMELEGIRVDTRVLEVMGKDILEEVSKLTKEIYELSGCEFNIASPKQLGEVLFEKLGLPHAKKNKTGYVTDASVLEKLVGYPIVDKILMYRMFTKLYSTYIEGILKAVSSDGKIHTIYTQVLTRTGRLSSIEPNLQNIPVRNEYGKMIRKAFVPEDDSVILSSDYSQIELRMFAHLANNEDMIGAFKQDIDIHAKTASDIFGVTLDEVTKDMRRTAKAVNFGILYGISSYGLASDLGIPVKEAKSFIDRYFDTYPGIKEFMDETIKNAYQLGYVKTIMNRKRIIDELSSSNYNVRSMGERMALNTPVQGSSADILKKAMVLVDREFSKRNLQSKMLLQVHDELIFNCVNSEKEIVIEIVKRVMEQVVSLKVPLVVDIEYGSNWYDAK